MKEADKASKLVLSFVHVFYKIESKPIMNATKLQDYLYEYIPISAAFQINVQELTADKVILRAPIKPNINHKKTVFGGSLHCVATLACWSLLFTKLEQFIKPVEIVIARSGIKYLTPVTTDFHAECRMGDICNFQHLETMLTKKGKGHICLNAKIYQDNKLAVDYCGEFVAIVGRNSCLSELC